MTGTGAVSLQHDGAIATVRVGHGYRANALGTRDWQALAALVDELAEDSALHAVVVCGRGTSTFSAGSDMREWLGAEPATVDESFAAMEEALSSIECLPVPVIAQIRGAAVGAGCQLACACDLRVIAEDARIGMPIARWGILVPPMFATRIARLGGPAVALNMLLTGQLVDGAEAVRLGLATTCVPDGDLNAATAALLASITAHPPAAVRAAKSAVHAFTEPVRDHILRLPTRPAADHESMQLSLNSFLSRVTTAN